MVDFDAFFCYNSWIHIFMKTKTLTPETAEETAMRFVQKQFTIGVISPLNDKHRAELLFKAAEPLCELGFSLSVLAVGNQESQEQCFELSQRYGDRFELLESIPSNRTKVLGKAQVVLFTSAPDKDLLKELAKKGVVPIMPYDDSLAVDFVGFDVQQEQGNCFLYDPENFWECLATAIRAYENFKFPYDWGNLRKNLKKTFEV